jgi:hypothetical protein
MKVLTGWPVPVFLFLIFGALILTSDSPPAGIAATFFGLLLVLLLWGVFREFSLHAEISRALSVGDGPTAAKLAEAQLARRSARRRGPFLIYRAMAHELTGDWAAIDGDLAEAKPEVLRGTGGGASWQQVAHCLRVGAWCELGDVSRARALFDEEVAQRERLRAIAMRAADQSGQSGQSGMGSIYAILTEGRLRFAEGDLAGAQEKLAQLTKNIRLAPAQRAIAFHYLARAARLEGRAAEASKRIASAAALTPASWFARMPAEEPAVADKAAAAPS